MTNSFGFNNVIEVIRNSSFVKTAILVTSDKVYENVEKKNGYKETDRLAGIDPYSASKSCAEIIYKSYFKSFLINTNLKSAIGRAGNVIGGGDWADNRIIPDIVRSKYKKKKLIIKNPNSTRPWQHVLEPISGYLLLGQILNSNNQKVNGESFNFGPPSNQNKKVRELLNIFNKKIKFKKHNDKKLYESKLLKLNCKKASRFLYWKSVLNFKTLLQFTSEWYENFYIKKKNSFNFTVDQIKKYENIAKKKEIEMGKVLRKKIDVIKLNKNENLYKITQDKRLLNSFREIYVSEIKPRSKKKWKLSNYITQNIFILNSKIKIIYKNKL